MIISKTPLRISLFGGGTDFKEYYSQYGGSTFSFAIDKYIYVIVNKRFDPEIVVNYSRKEKVSRVSDIEHDLVREACMLNNIDHSIEVTTLSDIPSSGSGLGSSSTVTVGLLNALSGYKSYQKSSEQLIEEACRIEIDILNKPIGIQDQAIAGFGGFGLFTYSGERNIACERYYEHKDIFEQLVGNLLLFYTNTTRSADAILNTQKANIGDKMLELHSLKQLAIEAANSIKSGEIDRIGNMLHESWKLKKTLAKNITNSEIDFMYETAIRNGALGGKICGAGGGGFLLLYCPIQHQGRLRNSLNKYRCLPIRLATDGSKIVFNMRD